MIALAAEAADDVDDEIYTARDAIRTCVSDANFSSTGTNACYKGRVLNFNYTMPQEFGSIITKLRKIESSRKTIV